MYNGYVKFPDDWDAELRGFLENYESPCGGEWDGFHVYIESKLKSYFNLKKRYSMSNMGLVSYNRRFLYAAVGAPGSTHDARILRTYSLLSDEISSLSIYSDTFTHDARTERVMTRTFSHLTYSNKLLTSEERKRNKELQ